MKAKEADNYSFSSVCQKISSRKYDKSEIAEDIKLLAEFAACFFADNTAAAVGATAVGATAAAASAVSVATVITLISKKTKILDAVKRIIELLSKDIPSYEDRYERMQEAYTILWVASFFDAFEKAVPSAIIKELELIPEDKKAIANPLCLSGIIENEHSDTEIELPDLVFGIDRVFTHLKAVYAAMTKRLLEFIMGLAFSDNNDEKKIRTLYEKLKKLPEMAINTFKDQYLTLCTKFDGFAAYLNLEKEREYSILANTRNKALVNLIVKTREDTASGFRSLEEAVFALPQTQRDQDVKEITDHIKQHYKDAIMRPVVETEDFDDTEELIYPSIDEAFVPQRYKLLEYTSKDMRLELESLWDDYKPQNNMQSFWGKYLLDEKSASYILLILGDPGSGKSLLTEMVSAKISSDAELVVRIPLRQYSNQISDDDIEEMVCRQIKEDGDARKKIDSFKEIAGESSQCCITIIFDGYDEVQQATGLAYPSFLKKLHAFQKHCLKEKRPIRIVVTSRRTLIDKADIPNGTLVMKLLTFAQKQKERWIDTWNKYNHDLLENSGLKDFKLPTKNDEIDEIASQPLLLLMLAIYDADFEAHQNALQATVEAKDESFNRMRLYDELIHRFIRRELSKGQRGIETGYNNLDRTKQEELVNIEMKKLGIAALGMFVRQRLWITVSDLNTDFIKLQAKTIYYKTEDALENGEIFLGSFFFIHDSRTKDKNDSKSRYNNHERNASFVFLHKTFYEFLVADYILDSVLKYALFLAKCKQFDKDHYKDLLVSFDQKFSQVYMALNGAPICAEPEITFMISEWGPKKISAMLEEEKLSEEDVLIVIGDMIEKYMECIRASTMNTANDQSLLPDWPIPQRNALYILNLITVKVLFEGSWKTELDKWRFLAQYIKLYTLVSKEKQTDVSGEKRLAASEELPLRFMALFQIQSENEHIVIQMRDTLMELTDQNPLDNRIQVFSFLQDHISSKVYSLHSIHVPYDEKLAELAELVQYDNTISIEQQITQIKEAVIHGQITDTNQLEKHLYSFYNSIKESCFDYTSVFSWINWFCQLAKLSMVKWTYNPSISRCIAELSRVFLKLCNEQSNKSAWISVYTMWFDFVLNDFGGNSIEISEYAWHNIDIWKLPGQVLYEYVNNAPSYVVAHIPHNAFDISKKYEKYENTIDLRTYRKHDPKWFAGLFMFTRRSFGIESIRMQKLLHSVDIRSFDCSDMNVWQDLPSLLQEYIILEQSDLVRDVLNDISLNYEKLFTPALVEYAMIANTCHATTFLFSLFEIIEQENNERFPYTRGFLRVIYILQANGFDCFSKYAKKLYFETTWYYRIFLQDIVYAIKLSILLYQQYNNRKTLESNMVPKIILHVVDSLEFAFQQSPQAVIEFLRIIPIDIDKRNAIIINLISIGKIKGQTDEVRQLEEILHFPKI